MALTTRDITRVVGEIEPILRAGWIQKIQQPTARTLVFDIRVPGRTHRLLLSCQPDTARLHLASRPLPNPPTPPAFCQFLRAHFQGARIDEIRQVPNDRIVEIHLTSKEGPRKIVCELTGKTADILILDAEQRILRSLTQQHDRVGQTYRPPVKRESGSAGSKPTRFIESPGEGISISAAIEAYYQDKESTLALDQVKEARLRSLKKTLKKERRLIEAWREDLAKAIKYRDYARFGELIKANLGAIKKGADLITVTDYFDNTLPEVTIPLDTTKSPQGNMDDYFRKHRKCLAAERELQPRIERAEHDVERLQQELQAIEQGTWTPPTLQPAKPMPLRATKGKDEKSDKRARGPFRRFVSTDGAQIFVGRNARENDELTFGLAKSDDLWLHARGTPGSHVIVRLEKGADPQLETIRDAATLALLYSDLKKSGKGDVIYTRRKWVKKAKGQALGAVTVTQEKSLHVNLDKKRLDAIKARSTHS
jgi:predicted ribosome quality control (RQC) complex YloA/Tae2 family protein